MTSILDQHRFSNGVLQVTDGEIRVHCDLCDLDLGGPVGDLLEAGDLFRPHWEESRHQRKKARSKAAYIPKSERPKLDWE